MKKDLHISLARLRQLLRYDPDTGAITWVRSTAKVCAGDIAGKLDGHGYRQIRIDRRVYMGHCIAWALYTGEWPIFELDHRDLDKANNRWRNLRPSTRSLNCANKPLQSNNSSGFKGVSAHGQRWRAQINIAGKRTLLGVFLTKEEAANAYREAAIAEYGEFARLPLEAADNG